jgi:hypothetical protein
MGGAANALGQFASSAGEATGLSNIGQGILDLFTGGGGAPTPGAPGAPPSLDFMGPPAPGPTGVGQELVGPPSPYQSPNFLQGFAQGFLGGVPGAGADEPLSAGGELGGGLGQLFHAINTLRGASGRGGGDVPVLGPIVSGAARHLAGPVMAPGYVPATAPQSGLIHGLINAFTFGLLNKPEMSVASRGSV